MWSWRFVLVAMVLAMAASPSGARESFYDVLGVGRSATQHEIRKRFRQLSRELHPDVNADSNAKERFSRVLEAYAVLDDPTRRAQYDHQTFSSWGGRWNVPDVAIESKTKQLGVEDLVVRLQGYRGPRLALVQVFSHSSPASRVFAPAWEMMAESSWIRHNADLFRFDATDELLAELAGFDTSAVPSLVLFQDGVAHAVPELPIGNTQRSVSHVESFVAGFVQPAVDDVLNNAQSINTEEALRARLREQAFGRTAVGVTTGDNQAQVIIRALLSMNDDIAVFAAPVSLFATLLDKCGLSSGIRSTSVWVFNSHTGDPCTSSRFPSRRLDDVDGIVRFVRKRHAKPLPLLTNRSAPVVCSDGCLVLVDRMCSGKVIDIAVLRGRAMTGCATEEPSFATLDQSKEPTPFTLLYLRPDGFAAQAVRLGDDLVAVEHAVRRAALSRLPDYWGLSPRSVTSTGNAWKPWLLNVVGDGMIVHVGTLVVLYAVVASLRHRGRPEAPRPHRSHAEGNHESSPPQAASRTYPGRSGQHEGTRRSVPAIMRSDFADAARRTLMILLFAASEGVKAPSEVAKLLIYPDVRVRAVPEKQRDWWAWLRRVAHQSVGEAVERRSALVVAVRPATKQAAVKPFDRSLVLWVDAVLEGSVALELVVDVANLTL